MLMGNNLARPLIADHLVEGETRPGEEIVLKIDQFLVHDGIGPLCALQLEAMGVEQISGERTPDSSNRREAVIEPHFLLLPLGRWRWMQSARLV
jgi:hypothetical protein